METMFKMSKGYSKSKRVRFAAQYGNVEMFVSKSVDCRVEGGGGRASEYRII